MHLGPYDVDIKLIDVKQLVNVIDKCTEPVYLITNEGDILNLKSTLCRLSGIFNTITNGSFENAIIRCSNVEDTQRIFKLNLYGFRETT